jgi:hypothetical protein
MSESKLDFSEKVPEMESAPPQPTHQASRAAGLKRGKLSLGAFGLILLLVAVIVLSSTLATISMARPFVSAYERQNILGAIQDRLVVRQLRQSVQEMLFILSSYTGEQDPSALLVEVDSNRKGFDQELAEVQQQAQSIFSPSELALLDELAAAQGEHRLTFDLLAQAYLSGNKQEADRLEEIVRSEDQAMRQKMQTLSFLVEGNWQADLQEFTGRARNALIIAILGLVLLIILTTWAIYLAGKLTDPLLALTNAVVAIGGGHFRSEMVADVAGRGDALGHFARRLEDLSDVLKKRDDLLENEISDMKQQLYQQRRRKQLPVLRDPQER